MTTTKTTPSAPTGRLPTEHGQGPRTKQAQEWLDEAHRNCVQCAETIVKIEKALGVYGGSAIILSQGALSGVNKTLGLIAEMEEEIRILREKKNG